MMSLSKSLLKKSLWLAGLAIAAVATAQTGDWPTFKAGNDRTGVNGLPNTSGPGQAYLTWFDPQLLNTDRPITLDNTDFGTNTAVSFPGEGPFPTPLNGSFASAKANSYFPQNYNYVNPPLNLNSATEWAWPSNGEEAPFSFLTPIRDVPVGANGINPNSRYPAYLYTQVTQGSPDRDPTHAYQPGDIRWFQYNFLGTPNVPRNYALSAWLPVGPMRKNGGLVYPQRYFTYEITWGPAANRKRYVDVVDTYASGGGFVRLGNGGAATNMVFPWDGINPISVRLYNIVPRNDDGTLTMLYTPNPTAAPAHREDDVKKYVVYADAMKAEPVSGSYTASVVAARTDPAVAASGLMIAAKNELTVSTVGATSRTVSTGRAIAYHYDNVNRRWIQNWRFAPNEISSDSNVVDDASPLNVVGTYTADTTFPHFAGTDDYVAPIAAIADGTVTYQPTLGSGSYSVYIYLPGDPKDVNGIPVPTFGNQVKYQVIAEGLTFDYVLDQGAGGGWVRLSDRRFNVDDNFPSIRVVATNGSDLATDLGKTAYADAVRFVGDKNEEITSTPVYATARIRKNTVGNPVQNTQVVIVADESGRIHCLDAVGNGDGTTTEYWAYPSLLAPAQDPNIQTTTEDGDGTVLKAEMPSGFDLSSALVQRVLGNDFLYIGSTNGRVYCINMTGRGDYSRTVPGTTTRRWTYPSTYPSTTSTPTSNLGAFKGSITFTDTATGPAVLVPTMQGRLYSLDARGGTDKSTTIKWAFPAVNQETLGPIAMTPAVGQGNVYFGTLRKNDADGRFFALNVNNGAQVWEFTPPSLPLGDPNAVYQGADDYLSSPAYVSLNTLEGTGTGGVIYMLNQNQLLSCIDASTGGIYWQTEELFAGSRGALTYTTMLAYDNTGTLADTKLIMVPTQDGRLAGMKASRAANDLNIFGIITPGSTIVSGKLFWGYQTQGDQLTASISVANGSMFAGDSAGYLYAFSNTPGAYGPGDFVPGQSLITPNNPLGDVFKKAKMKIIGKDDYFRLRLPLGDANQMTYPEAVAAAESTRAAFEWGETAYVLVYDFPYTTRDVNNNVVPPPVVQVSFSVDGRSVRGVSAEARQFPSQGVKTLKDVLPDIGSPNNAAGDTPLDGYAIIAYPFQGGGVNALPPGDVTVNFTISTQSLNGNRAQQNIATNPIYASRTFRMANPLAISMGTTPGGDDSIGYNINPDTPERLTNGSVDIAGETALKSLLGASTGYINHGTSGSRFIYVYDMSMMATLRPDGGLDNVRLTRQDLARQAGSAGVYKALNAVLYPNFEDLPVNVPNNSIDYPNIGMENVRATKEPTGDAENPLFNGVTLKPPLIRDSGVNRKIEEGDPLDKRIFQPTIFEMAVDVPRFQPPVGFPAGVGAIKDSTGKTYNTGYLQGYFGRVNIFVDSLQNGNLDVAQREAYRSFNLATSIPPDEKIAVVSPSVDLGSLPTGAGTSALARPGFAFNTSGATGGRVLNPWASPTNNLFANNFKEFIVENPGNVNLLDLRLAKADNATNGFQPWTFTSLTNDPLAWIDGGWKTSGGDLYGGNLWSNLDYQFSPWPGGINPSRNVILQKPRTSDRIASRLSVNPERRANPALGAAGGALFTNTNRFPTGNPKVSISVPIGFPSGRYVQRLRVIEQSATNAWEPVTPSWDLIGPNQAETISEPGFDLLFNVRESRLTTSFTPGGDAMLDDLASKNNVAGYFNQQPAMVRDMDGSLILAFASNRPRWQYDGTQPADTSSHSGIFLASLDSAWQFNSGGMTGPGSEQPFSPFSDLNNWNPTGNGSWWNRSVAQFPTDSPNTVFNKQPGETILDQTLVYRNPSFPQNGTVDPFTNRLIQSGMTMALVGDADKQTPSGRVSESRLIATTIKPTAAGVVNPQGLRVMNSDVSSAKGKPSLVQTESGDTMVFYTSVNAGQARIYYSLLNANGFSAPNLLPIGNGFETVSNPSATGRIYRGAQIGFLNTNQGVVELTFAGKLRGRQNQEVFIGRLLVDSFHNLYTNADGTLMPDRIFSWQSAQSNERIASEGNGVYRARGVVWNKDYVGNGFTGWRITQTIASGASQDLLVPNTQQYDPQTGVYSYNTILGGKAYLDPNLGTVRFANSAPSPNAVINLSYQPGFLRVTPTGTAGYASPVGLFDTHFVPNRNFWQVINSNEPQDNRYIFTYNRSASGVEQTARPYISTYRFGVQLPYRIDPTSVQVLDNTDSYQVDPVNGRIYFSDRDENRTVRINYRGIAADGSFVTPPQVTANVAWIVEHSDQQLPIEGAVNESNLTSFLDPFTFRYQGNPRPPLVWLFWTSTRSGNPDIYFQTVAPNWSPIPLGQ